MSYERILEKEKALAAEVEAMLQEANAVDKADDERFGADRLGDELPELLQRYDGCPVVVATGYFVRTQQLVLGSVKGECAHARQAPGVRAAMTGSLLQISRFIVLG